MKVKYNRLFKLLIDRGMNKGDLQHKASVSTSVIAKLSKGQSVTTDVLLKICAALDCDFADIMEVDREGYINEEVFVNGKNILNTSSDNSFGHQIWDTANELQNSKVD